MQMASQPRNYCFNFSLLLFLLLGNTGTGSKISMLESYYEMESTWLFELHTTFQQFVLVAFVVDSDTRR